MNIFSFKVFRYNIQVVSELEDNISLLCTISIIIESVDSISRDGTDTPYM